MAKQFCQLMWRRKKLDAVADEVIVGLRRWLASDRFARGIIPNPATFLNQERWKDTPPAAEVVGRPGGLLVRELSPAEKEAALAEAAEREAVLNMPRNEGRMA
jgi:hypothetical protein